MAYIYRMINEIIWAPWRAGFILGKKSRGCVFCRAGKSSEKRVPLVLFRGRYNFILMNKYPYTSGHLLVTPYRHVGTFAPLSEAEANEHFRLVRRATVVLQKKLKPDGMNIGVNLGRAAGAGVLGHVHTHLVCRWSGDSNFLPVIGQTRLQSLDIEMMYDVLLEGFKKPRQR